MREVVMQMMTTLNGRLDDPDAWVRGVPDDLYAELDRFYSGFDTILVGRATYAEMVEYWPGAEFAESGSATSRCMARKMNSYRKCVFTTAPDPPALEWANAEAVSVAGDRDVAAFVRDLKAQPGGGIHLAGGARLAQTIVRLGLVDRYHLFMHPAVSPGRTWVEAIEGDRSLELVSAAAYSNGVVGLIYEAVPSPWS